MKYCQNCGAAINDNAVICVQCGCPVNNVAPVEDKVNVWLVILSALIPLVGIIYWAVKKNERPKNAKACGIAGLVSWALGFISMML